MLSHNQQGPDTDSKLESVLAALERQLPQLSSEDEWQTLSSLLRDNTHGSDVESPLPLLQATAQRRATFIHNLTLRLAARAAHAQRIADGYGSLSAPIRKLPIDLLRVIFSPICRSNRIIHGSGRLEVDVPAITLRHVCTHWRYVAEATPELWSTLSVDNWDASASRSARNAIQLVLDHSGNFPLHISYTNGTRKKGMLEDSLGDLVLLGTQSHRFESLSLVTHALTLETNVFPFSKATYFPLLKHLFLSITSVESPIQLFASAPSLRSLALSMYGIEDISLPWHQIQKFEMEEANFSEVVHALRHGTNLVEIKTDVIEWDGIRGDPSLPVISTSLTSLSFGISSFHEATNGQLFDSLTLPSLSHLRINGIRLRDSETRKYIDFKDGFPSEKLVDLISRSNCSLTHLELHDVSVLPDGLIRVLESTPSLSHLSITELYTSDLLEDGLSATTQLFERIKATDSGLDSMDGSQLILLPVLECLFLDLSGVTSFSDSVFTYMVTSRCRPSTYGEPLRLQDVTLRMPMRVMELNSVEQLRDVAKMNQELSLSIVDATGNLI